VLRFWSIENSTRILDYSQDAVSCPIPGQDLCLLYDVRHRGHLEPNFFCQELIKAVTGIFKPWLICQRVPGA
jgi:hypothetical protein